MKKETIKKQTIQIGKSGLFINEKIDDDIEILTISGTYIEYIDVSLLPKSLECLCIYSRLFNDKLDLSKFQYLKVLQIYCFDFNQSLQLPPQIESVAIHSDKFNQPIENLNLPDKLLTLIINGHNFNQSLDNIPFNLFDLKVKSNNFNQSLTFFKKELQMKPFYSLYEIYSDTINFVSHKKPEI